MNEEEKQAIEILRNFEPDDLVECSIYIQAVEKITNLIDKQQKEIEYLKQQKEIENHTFNDKVVLETLKECVTKRSIRKLIKEKAKTDTYNFKTIAVKDIEELLGD